MPRRRTHAKATRSRMVCIRMTDDDYHQRALQARELGLTMSGLCERLVLDGKVDMNMRPAYRPMDPSLLNELRRIGNNANQIAHALNSNLPPDVVYAWKTASDLLRLLGREELLRQQTSAQPLKPARQVDAKLVQQLAEALSTRSQDNDPSAAQARDVFQRSVHLHSARPQDDVS